MPSINYLVIVCLESSISTQLNNIFTFFHQKLLLTESKFDNLCSTHEKLRVFSVGSVWSK